MPLSHANKEKKKTFLRLLKGNTLFYYDDLNFLWYHTKMHIQIRVALKLNSMSSLLLSSTVILLDMHFLPKV